MSFENMKPREHVYIFQMSTKGYVCTLPNKFDERGQGLLHNVINGLT